MTRRSIPAHAAVLIASSMFLGCGVTLVYGDAIGLDTLSLVGTSQLLPGNVIQLTDNQDPNPSGPPPAGGAWTTQTFNVAVPFTLNFGFVMSSFAGRLDNDGSAGDGIAFVIQNDPRGDTVLGEGASGMGFVGSSRVDLQACKLEYSIVSPK